MNLINRPGSYVYGLLLGLCACYSLMTILVFVGAVAFGSGFDARSVVILVLLSLIAGGLLLATIGACTRGKIFNQIAGLSSAAFLLYVLLFLGGFIARGNVSTNHDLLTHGLLAFAITAAVLYLSWLRICQMAKN